MTKTERQEAPSFVLVPTKTPETLLLSEQVPVAQRRVLLESGLGGRIRSGVVVGGGNIIAGWCLVSEKEQKSSIRLHCAQDRSSNGEE